MALNTKIAKFATLLFNNIEDTLYEYSEDGETITKEEFVNYILTMGEDKIISNSSYDYAFDVVDYLMKGAHFDVERDDFIEEISEGVKLAKRKIYKIRK